MLVVLGLLEQRHRAVLEVLNGATVMKVARRYGVGRQTLHDWLRRYARNGMATLSDRSCRSRTATCWWPPMPSASAPVSSAIPDPPPACASPGSPPRA